MNGENDNTMSKRCTGKNGHGKPCGAWAVRGKTKCALHLDPERAAKMGAKHGRRASPSTESQEIVELVELPKTANQVRDLLAETLTQVRGRKMDTRTANAMAYVATGLLRAIEVADFEARLDKLDGPRVSEEPDEPDGKS